MTISIKTSTEIDKMRLAGQLAANALCMIGEYVQPGVTTVELDQRCHDYIMAHGGYPASLGYHGFPKSMCTSVNHVVCHGIPAEKPLKAGDIVNIDIVVKLNGYHGDTSKMFYVGTPTVFAQRLCEVTQACLYAGIRLVKPGCKTGDIGAAIQTLAEKHRYSVVREYCGHGIGSQMHEQPQILHYGKAGEGVTLKPGMVFTIEPMINQGKRDIKLLGDGWTVITKDHKLSAQWEHTILVTETGYEVMTWREEEADKLSRVG